MPDEPPLHVVPILDRLGHGHRIGGLAVGAATVVAQREALGFVAGALRVGGAEGTLHGAAVALATVVAGLALLDDVVATDRRPRHVDRGRDPAAVRAAAVAVLGVAVVAHLAVVDRLVPAGGSGGGGGRVDVDDECGGGDREDGREHELAELAHDSVAFRLRHASTAGNGGRTAGNVRAPSNFV